jgi:hypothetical protein
MAGQLDFILSGRTADVYFMRTRHIMEMEDLQTRAKYGHWKKAH